MKKMNLLLAATLLVGNALGANTPKEKKQKSETVVFAVNMHCHNCKAKLEKNIPWEKGVKNLTVDLDNKTVTVVYNPQKTSEAQLQKAVEKLDFLCSKIETHNNE